MRGRIGRFGATLGGVLVRLVVARLLAPEPAPAAAPGRRIDPAEVPWRMPAELLARPSSVSDGELMARLRTDRGCLGALPRRHLACKAAGELARRVGAEPALTAALEETVTAAGRPGCVREAAVEALRGLGEGAARRALARMHGVAVRRAEWDGRGEDRALARRLAGALGGAPV